MEISERQKVKRQIYAEQMNFPANAGRIAELNRELRKYPPNIEEPHRYNFLRKVYERKSI